MKTSSYNRDTRDLEKKMRGTMGFNKLLLSQEKKALTVLFGVSLLFVLIELVMSILTKSQAVLMDAVFDTLELVMTMISINILPLIYKTFTQKQPFGYGQVETLLILLKGIMMVSVTIGIMVTSIQLILQGGVIIQHNLISYFEIFSTLLSLLLMTYLTSINKKINSPYISLEIKQWILDAGISLALGIGFLLPNLVQTSFLNNLTPYIDPLLSILLACFMLPVPFKTIISSCKDIFLFAPEDEILDVINEATQRILEHHGIVKNEIEVVRTGRKLWIWIYFTPEHDLISLKEMRSIQHRLETEMKIKVGDCYLEFLPDID
ncbi:MAG TPA: cation transporter [Firmicutes bacterium]|nr:cation transporter [Bacillota bacterium]